MRNQNFKKVRTLILLLFFSLFPDFSDADFFFFCFWLFPLFHWWVGWGQSKKMALILNLSWSPETGRGDALKVNLAHSTNSGASSASDNKRSHAAGKHSSRETVVAALKKLIKTSFYWITCRGIRTHLFIIELSSFHRSCKGQNSRWSTAAFWKGQFLFYFILSCHPIRLGFFCFVLNCIYTHEAPWYSFFLCI